MSSFKIEGLDEFKNFFKNMEKQAKDLKNTKEIPFPDLFTTSFMHKYTEFSSFDDLLESGGFHVETNEDFEAIPDAELDAHIASTTRFNSWDKMFETALDEYIGKKLDF